MHKNCLLVLHLMHLYFLFELKIKSLLYNKIASPMIVLCILEKAGLKTENIIDSGLCSVCNKDLIHSFRVEKQGYGLNTALISLLGK